MKIILPLSIAAVLMTTAAHAQMKLPELKKQPTPQAVLDEHFAALNACDWDRLLAQYPEDAQIHLANGMIIKGRAAIGDLFVPFYATTNTGDLANRTDVFASLVSSAGAAAAAAQMSDALPMRAPTAGPLLVTLWENGH